MYATPARDAEGEHFLYRLFKKKLTTLEAVARIARRLDVPKADIAYAGLKDKQSVSEQLISIKGVGVPELRDPGLKLTLLGRRATPVSSQDIIANRFHLTVRGLTEDDLQSLGERLAALREYGLPNYFDSQRFGSLRHGQGLLAKDLVRGDAETALRLYMATPSPRDHSGDRHAKELIRRRWGDWERLAEPLRTTPYARILGHLAHAPADFVGAIGYMPRTIRALHLFAFQSLLWNHTTSYLLRDLVPKPERFTVPYQAGRLIFYRKLEPDLLARLRALKVPLAAAGTKAGDPDVALALERALETEGVTLPQLALPPATGAFFKEEPRDLLVFPGDLVATEPTADELNPGRRKVDLRFDLPRGSYATLVVKRLFRGGS